MTLSAHFSLEELTRSDYATRHGIDNRPPATMFASLGVLAAGLERVRTVLAVPIHVLSGYRCQRLNRAIGGSIYSQHMIGLAADFVAPGYGSPLAIAERLADRADDIDFDQLIAEGSWVHVSFSGTPRGEILTANFGEGGGVTYTRGLA